MLFISIPFLLFWIGYFLLHLLVPSRHRLWLVIAGGTVFYGYWNPAYVWIPHVLSLVAFAGAHWMAGAADPSSKRLRLIFVLAVLFAPLAVFKYADFLLQQGRSLAGAGAGGGLGLPLPLGISFMTFSLAAYVVDAYRGVFAVRRDFLGVNGYALFFPAMLNGPILRPHQLMLQLDRPGRALDAAMSAGVALFSVGLVKKLVFADQIAPFVDAVYGGAAPLTAEQYLLGIYGFSLQIYCDFSGYTDMALGLALLLGLQLPINFDRPYGAPSLIDFWRSWHMSLSNWFRDYVYIPLGGSRHGFLSQIGGLLATMGLVGLWHGASWTFVFWGLYHGGGIALAHGFRKSCGRLAARLPQWLAVLVTFHAVTLGWVLFRAADLGTSWRVLSGPFVAPTGDLASFASTHLFALCLLGVFIVTHRFDSHDAIHRLVARAPASLLWPALALMWTLAIAVSGGNSGRFIYFDF